MCHRIFRRSAACLLACLMALSGAADAQQAQMQIRKSPEPEEPRIGQLATGEEIRDQETLYCRDADIYVTVLGVAITCQPQQSNETSRKVVINDKQYPGMGAMVVQLVGDYRTMTRGDRDRLVVRYRAARNDMKNLCQLVGAGPVGTCREAVFVKWDYYDHD